MHDSRAIIQRRRNRERSQRIETIVDAAKRVFLSKGYFKATMDEIAMEAELSKPTIYLYFKTKDDLYCSLVLPVLEDIGDQLQEIEKKLAARTYVDGAALLHELFTGLVHSYQTAPDMFKIVQLFQQTNLLGELSEEMHLALEGRGRANFELARRIVGSAIEQGLIRAVAVHELVDVIWGLIVGIIQLEDAKSHRKKVSVGYLKPTIALAERILIAAIAAETPNSG